MEILPPNPIVCVDMDGTLAEWKNMTIPAQIPTDKINKIVRDTLYTEGYYFNLKPYKNMVKAIKELSKECEVFITSCVLPENDNYPNSHPEDDKNKWLDKYLPEIDSAHRIFVPDGEPKRKYIPFEPHSKVILLDDYTKNLKDWTFDGNAKGIKVLNGINDTHGSWMGSRLSILDAPSEIINSVKEELGMKTETKISLSDVETKEFMEFCVNNYKRLKDMSGEDIIKSFNKNKTIENVEERINTNEK